jgi:hypothetical protein
MATLMSCAAQTPQEERAAARPDTVATATAHPPADVASLAASVPDTPPKAFFPKEDESLLERNGVYFVPVGEGPLVRTVPVDRLFVDRGRVLSEEDFVTIFPAIQRMDPLRLGLDLSALTDRSVELLNRLRSASGFNLANSAVTMNGLRKLRLKSGKTLTIPRTITDAQRRELEHSMPGVVVR